MLWITPKPFFTSDRGIYETRYRDKMWLAKFELDALKNKANK